MCNITIKRLKQVSFTFIVILTLQAFGIFTHLFEKDFYREFHYPYDGDITRFVWQLRHNITPDVKPINSYDFQFIKSIANKCKTYQDEQIRLVYIVKSAPSDFDRRIAIRSAWGYEKRFSDVTIKTVFILGATSLKIQESLNEESDRFNDIIQANFTDSYFNNTFKTMMSYKWAVRFCPKAKFYMFVDDDYYVSTRNVLRYIRNPTNYPQYVEDPSYGLKKLVVNRKPLDVYDFELPDDVRLYTGCGFKSSPHRHMTSKWMVSLAEYPYHMWPPYITGGAYILSREALQDMYYASFYTKHFRFDDIYVALLAYKMNIEPFHSEYFDFYKRRYVPKDFKYTIASHGYGDHEELLKVWTEQRSLGNA